MQEEFNKNYKGKVKAAATLDEGSGEQLEGDAGQPGTSGHRKRRKVSAASFFADSDSEESEEEPDATKDELKEYLALPQIKHKLKSLYKSEQQVNNWWLQHRELVPQPRGDGAPVPRLPRDIGICRAALLQGGRRLLGQAQELGGGDSRENHVRQRKPALRG